MSSYYFNLWVTWETYFENSIPRIDFALGCQLISNFCALKGSKALQVWDGIMPDLMTLLVQLNKWLDSDWSIDVFLLRSCASTHPQLHLCLGDNFLMQRDNAPISYQSIFAKLFWRARHQFDVLAISVAKFEYHGKRLLALVATYLWWATILFYWWALVCCWCCCFKSK